MSEHCCGEEKPKQDACCAADEHDHRASWFDPQKAIKIFTPISGAFWVLAFGLSFTAVPEYVSIVLYLGAIATGGVFVVVSAVRGLFRQRFLNISFLVVIASVGALFIGEFGEAAAVVFLFSLSELFESYGVERSRRAVAALIDRSPKTARLLDGTNVPVGDVHVGTIVAVKPGEMIPLDGVVVKGTSAVDEAAVTGESVPVDKAPESTVFAGTMNVHGYLEVRVEKESKDSTFARIIALIEEAQVSRAPTQAFIDRFAKYYTPGIVVLAVLIAAVPPLLFGQEFSDWLYKALTLLVLACPCALVIATPVAIASAIGGASRHGILIKGGRYLEQLAEVEAVAFDKTRTLTHGRHTVSEVISFDEHSKEEVIAEAAGVEAFSSHPLAEAIVVYAKAHNIAPHEMHSYEDTAGKGGSAHCTVCEARSVIGNKKLLADYNIDSASFAHKLEHLESEGKTVVLVANGTKAIGLIAIVDEIRSEAQEVVSTLTEMNIESIMITGDNAHSAQYVADAVGIHNVHASLLPEEKVEHVKRLKANDRAVAMVGDGINDAPSLVTADVGIAIGAGGTDAAIESSDVTLLSGDLSAVPRAIRLARAAMRTMQFNIALAIGVKLLFLILVPFGLTNLVMAIAADSGMAILVILNSLRLFAQK